jgi:hypothetical protein
MSGDTYAKLMSSIVTSSVWVEPHTTFKVWIALLALKDRNGVVRAAVPGLAQLCGVTLEECQRALTTFLSPDPYSRTQEFEGRRIEPVDGGWRVLNHDYYRGLESQEKRRQYNADWMRRKREAEKAAANGGGVDDPQPPRVDESGDIQIQIQNTEKAKATPLPPEGEDAAGAALGKAPGSKEYTAIFERFWAAYPTPHKGSKAKAFDSWQRKRLAAAATTLIEDVTRRGAEHGEWKRESGRFIPHVTTYLNARTWEEPIVAASRGSTPARDRASVENSNRQAADAFAGDDDAR